MTDVVADRVVVEYQVMAQPYLRAMADMEARSQKTYGSVLSGGEKMEQGLRSSLLNSSAAADMLGRSLGMVTAALGAREVIRYADSWTAAGNKITAMGTPLEDQQRRLKQLADVAVDTRANFEATVQTFSRLEMSTKGLGKSQSDLLRITETINKAFAVGGAAPSEQFAASLQLSQALSSGVLGGDELRSVRENAPVIARAIADVMGTTVGNLKNLGEQGQLTSAVVIEALERLGPEVDKAFGQTVPTIGQALDNLKTRLTEFVGAASQTSGSGQVIAGSINLIAQNFDQLADAALVVGAVFAGRYASGIANAAGAEAQLLAAHANGTAVLINSAEASRQRAAAALNEANALGVAAAAKADQATVNAAALRQDLEVLAVERSKAQQYLAAQITENGRRMQTAALIEIRQSELALERQLAAAEMTLAEARAAEMTATARATAAQEAYSVAAAASTLRMQALAMGSKFLQNTLAFFGGPVGLAITGLSVAMIALAGATDKVAEATERARGAEDGFWRVVDRGTLKIIAQNKELAENERRWNAKVVRDNGSVLSAGASDLTIGGSKDYPNARHTWSGAMAPDQLAVAREADALIGKFKSAGDRSGDAFLRLENSMLSLQERWPGFGERTIAQIKNLRMLAQESEKAAARLAVLNGNATPRDIKIIRNAEGGTEFGGTASPPSSASVHSDAFTKAVEAAKERTASLQVESQVAGKSVYEQERAKAALELRTAADKDLAKAQEKRAQITSKSAAATKQADSELAAATTLHEQRVKQVDALAEALARQASAADKAKKAASADRRENSDTAKQRRIAAANDVDTLLAEANRDLTKVQTDAAVRAAGTFDAYTKARVAQVVADAAAQIDVIEAKGKEELAKLNKMKPGWSGYQGAVDKVNAATTAKKETVNTKAQSDIADEFLASTVRETQAMRDDIEAMGMTREEADRLLHSKQLIAIANEAERNGLASVAEAARAAAANYDQVSKSIEQMRRANERAVDEADALRDAFAGVANGNRNVIESLKQTAIQIEIVDPLIEKLFGRRGTPASGLIGSNMSSVFGGTTLMDSLFNLIPGFAGGTDYAPGGTAKLAEQGPEIVMRPGLYDLPRGSRVIPTVPTLNALSRGTSQTISIGGASVVVQGSADPATAGIVRDELAAYHNRLAQSLPALIYKAQRDHF